MRFFVIPPIKHMDLALEGTAGIYCLAHLYLQNEDYILKLQKVRLNQKMVNFNRLLYLILIELR